MTAIAKDMERYKVELITLQETKWKGNRCMDADSFYIQGKINKIKMGWR